MTTLDDASWPPAPDERAGSFDVRSWLAGLAQISVDGVQFVGESERAGRRTVTYACAGSTAKVSMSPVSGTAAWELVAELDGMADRVVLPGATRFIWRPPRGTHA